MNSYKFNQSLRILFKLLIAFLISGLRISIQDFLYHLLCKKLEESAGDTSKSGSSPDINRFKYSS